MAQNAPLGVKLLRAQNAMQTSVRQSMTEKEPQEVLLENRERPQIGGIFGKNYRSGRTISYAATQNIANKGLQF